MRYRKSGMAAIAALSLGFASLAGSTPAQAQHHGGGHGGGHYGGHGGGHYGGHGGGHFGGGFATGLALGAIGGGYGYGGECYLRRQVVGYTHHGRPIVRRVRVCH